MEICGLLSNPNYNYLERPILKEILINKLNSNIPIIIVRGDKNVGKTELVKHHIMELNDNKYNILCWFSCKDEVEFTQSMIQVASDLKRYNQDANISIEGKDKAGILNELKKYFKAHVNWLIVLNDVTNINTLSLIPEWPKGKIIITTALPKHDIPSNYPDPIEVAYLKEQEAFDYAYQKLLNVNITTEQIKSILKRANNMPLEFVETIRFIKNLNMPLQVFTKIAEKSSNLNFIRFDYFRTVATKEEKNTIFEIALLFVQVCVYLKVDFLSNNLLDKLYNKLDVNKQHSLKAILAKLIEYALLSGEDNKYRIDNEIAEIIIQEHQQQSNLGYLKKSLLVLEDFSWKRTDEDKSYKDINKDLELSHHAAIICKHFNKFENQIISVADKQLLYQYIKVANSLGRFYLVQYLYEDALIYLRKARELIKKTDVDFIKDLLSEDKKKRESVRNRLEKNLLEKNLVEIYAQELLHNIGNTILNYFEYNLETLKEAEETLGESLKLQKYLYKEEKIDNDSAANFTLRTLIRFFRDCAKILINKNDDKEAKIQLEKAQGLLQELGAMNLPLNIKQLWYLEQGIVNKLLKDYEKAEQKLIEALKLFEEYSYPQDKLAKDKANILLWLAEIYRDHAKINHNIAVSLRLKSSDTLLAAFKLTQYDKLFLPEIKDNNFSKNSADMEKIFSTIGLQNLARIYEGFALTSADEDLIGLAYKFAKYALYIQEHLYGKNKQHFHYQKTLNIYLDLKDKLNTAQTKIGLKPKDNPSPESIQVLHNLDEKTSFNQDSQSYLNKAEYNYNKKCFKMASENYYKFIELFKIEKSQKKINLDILVHYAMALYRIGEYKKSQAKLKEFLPSEKEFKNYKAIYNDCIISITNKRKQDEMDSINLKTKNYDIGTLSLYQKHFFYEFISHVIKAAKKDYSMPSSKEKRFMLLKAFSHLLNIDMGGGFAGATASIKIPLGRVLNDVADIYRSIEQTGRELKQKEIDTLFEKLTDPLQDILSKVGKELAVEFAWQIARLDRKVNIEKLAKYLAKKMIKYIASGRLIEDKLLGSDSYEYLCAQLLASVYHLEIKQKDKIKYPVNKLDTKDWTLKGTVEQSGIMLKDSNKKTYFYTRNNKELDKHIKYDYRYGVEHTKLLMEFFKSSDYYDRYESRLEADEALTKAQKKSCVIQ